MKTTYYYIQEKWPKANWQTLKGCGKFYSKSEVDEYIKGIKRLYKPYFKLRILKVTEEVVCAS